MTYIDFISQFEVFENPPERDGYHRHHISPVSEQTEPDNRQVYLTWSQHFWAHLLYDREHGTKTAKMFLNTCDKSADFFDCYEKCLAYTYTFIKKTEAAKQKISESMKGKSNALGHKLSIESRQKISESQKGKHHSEDTKKKLSEINKGKPKPPFSESHRQNLSLALTGRHLSEETRKKMSMNNAKTNLGKTLSEDTRKKISKSNGGRHWYHDTSSEVFTHECPEGFVPGRLKSPT